MDVTPDNWLLPLGTPGIPTPMGSRMTEETACLRTGKGAAGNFLTDEMMLLSMERATQKSYEHFGVQHVTRFDPELGDNI